MDNKEGWLASENFAGWPQIVRRGLFKVRTGSALNLRQRDFAVGLERSDVG
jgi:hypothetical protein